MDMGLRAKHMGLQASLGQPARLQLGDVLVRQRVEREPRVEVLAARLLTDLRQLEVVHAEHL